MSRYGELSKAELVAQLEQRDRRDATRFGLVWEARAADRDAALNADFIALDLDTELSCGNTPWRNLIVEGDNYDALRHLRMAFAGRVKCIYIDPPYNTGNRDFVYNDHFLDREDAWRHSKWCDFMFRRLQLAKRLLAPDGAIFVSIDDNELFTLGMLMNRVFGENAHVATCVWQKRYSRENRGAIGDAHEYLLVYSPQPDLFKERRGRIVLTEQQAKVYTNPNSDPAGPWATVSMNAQGYRPNQMYDIVSPNGKVHRPPEGRCWAMLESEFLKLKAKGKIHWGKDGNGVPRIIRYLHEVEGVVPWTWWPHEEVGHTDEARKEIRKWLETQTAFETPKPVRLIERVLQIAATEPDDLVLDFFAGSGTTAHAVHKVNAADGGHRRCILVSNTEATTDDPEKNLCRDVCAKRVRRVIEGFNGTPGLGGDFAYLRCRRVPAGRLLHLDHAAIWTALQLIHCNRLAPYVAEAPYQLAEEDGQALVYVPRFRRTDAATLRQRLDAVTSATVFSWQPDALRQQVPGSHVQHESAAEYLSRKFATGANA